MRIFLIFLVSVGAAAILLGLALIEVLSRIDVERMLVFAVASWILGSGLLTTRSSRYSIYVLALGAVVLALVAQWALLEGHRSKIDGLFDYIANQVAQYTSWTPGAGVKLTESEVLWYLCFGGLVGYIVLRLLSFSIIEVCIRIGRLISWFLRWVRRRVNSKSRSSASIAEVFSPGGVGPNARPVIVPPQVGFVAQTLALSAIFIGLAIAFIPQLSSISPFNSFHANFVWFGPWVLLLESCGFFEALGGGFKLGTIKGRSPLVESLKPRVQELFAEYIRKYGEVLLRTAVISGVSNRHGEGGQERPIGDSPFASRLRSRLRSLGLGSAVTSGILDFRDSVIDGGVGLISETLSESHLIFLSELILEHEVQGESVLLVCREGSEDALKSALEQQADQLVAVLTRRWAVYRPPQQTVAHDTEVSMIVCSDRRLDQLLDEFQGHGATLRRLGLIILTDFQDLDGAELRIDLGRIWRIVRRSNTTVIVQSEGYRQLESRIGAILGSAITKEVRWWPEAIGTRYVLFWRADPEARRKLNRILASGAPKPLDLHFLVPMLAWKRRHDVFLLDLAGDFDANAKENALDATHSMELDKKIVARLPSLRPSVELGATADYNVFLVSDYSSIPLLLNRNYSHVSNDEVLVLALSHPYLLRDWHFEILKKNGASALLDFTPISPRPLGGIVEVATILSRGMPREPLTQREIKRAFEQIPESLRQEFDLSPDHQGIRNLFGAVSTQQPSIHALDGGSAEREYFVSGTSNEGPKYLTIQLEGDAIESSGGENRLLEWDYGLGFAEQQRILVNNRFHHISGVYPKRGRVEANVVELKPDDSRRRYVFARRYRFPFLEGNEKRYNLVSNQWRIERGTGDRVRAVLFCASLERETRGYLDLPQAWPDGESTEDIVYHRCDPTIKARREFAHVVEMRFRSIDALGDEERERVAFTLCAVLQDFTKSLFPSYAHRLAVLSPDARNLVEENGKGKIDYHDILSPYFPSFIQTEAWQRERILGQEDDSITLYLVEDWPVDLGAARAFYDNIEQVLENMCRFLQWATAAIGHGRKLYHGFGMENLDEVFDYSGAAKFLSRFFYVDNLLLDEPSSTAEEHNSVTASEFGNDVADQADVELYCDFCASLCDSRSKRLSDGRKRCYSCQKSAINFEQFVRLYHDVRSAFASAYAVELPSEAQIHLLGADEIARALGRSFTPQASLTPRTVGFALRSGDDFNLVVENGAPRTATISMLVHELTHVWQFSVLPSGSDVDLDLLEGQAVFAEIDYLLNEPDGFSLATSIRDDMRGREDEYGRGYRRVAKLIEHGDPHLYSRFREMLLS